MLDTTLITDGPHNIRAVAVGRDGQTARTSVSVLVDNNDPLVDIVHPGEEDVVFIEDGELAFRVWTTDGSGIEQLTLTVDGEELEDVSEGDDEGMYESVIDLTEYSDLVESSLVYLELSATSEDLFGRQATETVSVPLARRVRWRRALPTGAVAGSPTVSRSGTTGYVVTSQGVVHALDMATGVEICRSSTVGEAFSGPALSHSGAMVFFGSSSGLRAINATDCSDQWSAQTAEYAQGTPRVHPTTGTVYFTTREGGLHAVNQAGEVLWSRIDVGLVRSAPTLVRDRNLVVVGSDDGSLYAIALDVMGNPLDGYAWRAATGGSLEASAALDQERLYVGSTDGNLYAFSTVDGSAVWPTPFETERMISSVPFIDVRGDVYVTSRDRNCYKLSPEGVLTWAYGVTSGIDYSGPVVDDRSGLVLFGELGATGSDGSRHGVLHAVDLDEGGNRWSVSFDGAVSSTPVLTDGTILIGTALGLVYSLFIDGEAARRELEL